jgi:hypothetical protein
VQLHGWLPLPHVVSVGEPFVHGGKHLHVLLWGVCPGPQAGPFAAVSEQWGPLLQLPVTPWTPAHPAWKFAVPHSPVGRQILHADWVAVEQPWQQQQQPQMLEQPSQL